jgi:diguanylate cyclase (GGDEF)-like protein
LCRIAAEHDKTALNSLLLEMLIRVANARRSAIYRHVTHKGKSFIIQNAELGDSGLQSQDAYLTSPYLGSSLDNFLLLKQCIAEGKAISEDEDGLHVCVFPILKHEAIYLLIQLERKTAFVQSELDLVATLIDFFRDHLALIDYAETDTLTGLLNRKTLDENLDRILANAVGDTGTQSNLNFPARRNPNPDDSRNWLAIIDIDHFKRINDTYGHLIGDEVLLLVSRLMKETFRLDDQLFRFGGEEFVVVLQPTTLEDASMVLDRFRRIVEEYNFPLAGKLTASLGFTHIEHYDNPSDLLDRADKALYYAKENGRNRMENYESLHRAGLLGYVHESSVIDLF